MTYMSYILFVSIMRYV